FSVTCLNTSVASVNNSAVCSCSCTSSCKRAVLCSTVFRRSRVERPTSAASQPIERNAKKRTNELHNIIQTEGDSQPANSQTDNIIADAVEHARALREPLSQPTTAHTSR